MSGWKGTIIRQNIDGAEVRRHINSNANNRLG